MRYGRIYMVTDKILNRSYIGQTLSSLDIRMKNHFKQAFNKLSSGYNDHFHKMIRILGKENFTFKTLEENIIENELNEKEKYYIEKYNTFEMGYNSNPGISTKSKAKNYSILDLEIVIKIRESIKNDKEKSLTDIAKDFNVDRSVISDINCGETWFDPAIEYPIRLSNIRKKLTKEDITEIYKYLEKSKSLKETANKFKLNPNTVRNINLGKIHYDENINYPIIPEVYKKNNLNVLSEIVQLLKENKLNNAEIGKKMNVSRKSVSNINLGKYHKKDILKIDPNISFPIR